MEAYSPKISIIVPVYNVEQYLRQCLNSLVNQTLKDIEIICINDCSPDNSLFILNEYAQNDSRIIVIDLKENKRQGGARNEGIKIAKGQYIGLVDSDDWVALDMYESLWEASRNGNVDMVCSDYYIYNNKTTATQYIENIPLNVVNGDIANLHKYVLLHGGRMWTNIIKKHLFFDNGLLYPERTAYEDNAIGASLWCACNKITKVNKALYYYRTQIRSTTSNNDYRFFDRLQTSIMSVENLKRLGFYARYKEEIDCMFYILYYKNTMYRVIFNFSTYPKEYISKIRETYYSRDFRDCIKSYKKHRKKLHEKSQTRILLYFMRICPWLLFKSYRAAKQVKKFFLHSNTHHHE